MRVVVPVRDIKGLKIQSGMVIRDEAMQPETKVAFTCDIPPGALARLLNVQRRGATLDVVFHAPQCTFDLKIGSTDQEDFESVGSELRSILGLGVRIHAERGTSATWSPRRARS